MIFKAAGLAWGLYSSNSANLKKESTPKNYGRKAQPKYKEGLTRYNPKQPNMTRSWHRWTLKRHTRQQEVDALILGRRHNNAGNEKVIKMLSTSYLLNKATPPLYFVQFVTRGLFDLEALVRAMIC